MNGSMLKASGTGPAAFSIDLVPETPAAHLS